MLLELLSQVLNELFKHMSIIFNMSLITVIKSTETRDILHCLALLHLSLCATELDFVEISLEGLLHKERL